LIGIRFSGGTISCNSTASAVFASLNIARRFHHRRPRVWRDANAVIANLIHALVYAPGANMPQDALDSLRIIDQ